MDQVRVRYEGSEHVIDVVHRKMRILLEFVAYIREEEWLIFWNSFRSLHHRQG